MAPGKRLLVEGRLEAGGAVFTALDPAQGWAGLHVDAGAHLVLDGATVQDVAGDAVTVDGGTARITDSFITGWAGDAGTGRTLNFGAMNVRVPYHGVVVHGPLMGGPGGGGAAERRDRPPQVIIEGDETLIGASAFQGVPFSGSGVKVLRGGRVELYEATVSGNGADGLHVANGTAELSGAQFTGNAGVGIRVSSGGGAAAGIFHVGRYAPMGENRLAGNGGGGLYVAAHGEFRRLPVLRRRRQLRRCQRIHLRRPERATRQRSCREWAGRRACIRNVCSGAGSLGGARQSLRRIPPISPDRSRSTSGTRRSKTRRRPRSALCPLGAPHRSLRRPARGQTCSPRPGATATPAASNRLLVRFPAS